MDNLWYKNIKKSRLTPPDYVFGIVWTFLYILLFVYYYLNITYGFFSQSMLFFYLQMMINVCWTYVFFQRKMLKTAFSMIVVIIIASLLSIYYLKNKQLGILLIPYILWLCLAGYLNLYIILNT